MLTNDNTPQQLFDLADPDYRAFKAVSKSSLDQFAKSPAHYKHVILDGNRPEPTAAMAIGSAFDTYLLTPKLFEATYAITPEVRRGTKAWDEFEAANEGKTLIKPDEFARIKAMAESVRRHEYANRLFSDGTPQVSYKWQDKSSGLLCKGRVDYLTSDGALVDLKSTQSAAPGEFSKSVLAFRYFLQAAMYLEAHAQATGTATDRFYFVAVEKEPPYLVAVYQLDHEALSHGFATMTAELNHLAACLKRNDWPGYHAGIETIGLPAWALK